MRRIECHLCNGGQGVHESTAEATACRRAVTSANDAAGIRTPYSAPIERDLPKGWDDLRLPRARAAHDAEL